MADVIAAVLNGCWYFGVGKDGCFRALGVDDSASDGAAFVVDI